MHSHQPLDAALEARMSRLPKAGLHFRFEGAFRWRTIRELHPDGNALPEREPWLNCARPFADFQDFSQVFRDYIQPATGTPEAIERHAFEMLADLAQQNVRYVEILLSPKFHMMLGLTKEQVWRAAGEPGRALLAEGLTAFCGVLGRPGKAAEASLVVHERIEFQTVAPPPSQWKLSPELDADLYVPLTPPRWQVACQCRSARRRHRSL